ncbi:MAG: hypothetical protein HZB46_13260 [Solirubrobacterales bacterium]|nr:hypothetical protein [Solirubrobacterales bacterium]
MRVAFVGQSTFFEACALEDGASAWTATFVEFRKDGDAGALRRALADFGPDAVVVFRPEVVPAGLLADLDAPTLGFLTEPLPRHGGVVAHDDLERRLWELGLVDGAQFDRIVSFDPHIARTADAVLPVWRSAPLPVADRYYAPVPARSGPPSPLFVGRSTPHREAFLARAKHHYDVLHLAFGVDADGLEEVMAQHDVGINVHNNPYPSFENRVCLHLAAAHLVLSEPLDPTHGLEPGIDFLEVHNAGQLELALWNLHRHPGLHHRIRVRGRRKAEQFRASRVWPRLLTDLLAEVRAHGGRRSRATSAV